MTIADSRVVAWRYVDQRGYVRAALDRNWLGTEAIPLVPLSLLAEAESRGDAWRDRFDEDTDVINALRASRDALQSRLDAVVAELERKAAWFDRHGAGMWTQADAETESNELRAAIGCATTGEGG